MYVNVYYNSASLKSEQRQIHAEDISFVKAMTFGESKKPTDSQGQAWTYLHVKRGNADSYSCYVPHPSTMVMPVLAMIQTEKETPPSPLFPLTNRGSEPELISRTLDLTDPKQMILTEWLRDPEDPDTILTRERALKFKPVPPEPRPAFTRPSL